jgi:hypothetical protein
VVSGWAILVGDRGWARMNTDKGVTMIKRIKADKSEQSKGSLAIGDETKGGPLRG